MGQNDVLSRRTILTNIVASASALAIGSGSAIATQESSRSLSVTRTKFSELNFSANIERPDLSQPPSVKCRQDWFFMDDKRRTYIPAHASVNPGQEMINSHDGIKKPKESPKRLFKEVPLEATVDGHQVAVPGSQSPKISIRRESGQVILKINGEEFSTDDGGKINAKVSTDIGKEDLGEVDLTVELNDFGEVKTLSHPSKSVVPLNKEIANHYKNILEQAENMDKNKNKIDVTVVKNKNALLVDHPDGGDE